MLCSLEEFMFESGDVNLDSIKSESEYDYVNTKTIDDHERWQSTGKYSKSITLAGKLIKKPNSALDDLELIAEKYSRILIKKHGSAFLAQVFEAGFLVASEDPENW